MKTWSYSSITYKLFNTGYFFVGWYAWLSLVLERY